ncbi:MAG: hypothetical protein J6Y13_08450, partial [Treponema sp.]|nr:hypothetical protein [Treponema sp.]
MDSVHDSYDSTGGYLNVEGGQYQTCTLTGNSTGGTITLSNGTQANLTGTYGTTGNSSGRAGNTVSLAASGSTEIKIEGCWTITFNGINNYGRLENTANMTYENGVTLEARVKVLSLVHDTYQELFGNWNA